MSTGTADQVVADTIEAAESVFGAGIEAIYTLGSLAHGGFAPLVSDVDVAIILTTTSSRTADQIAEVQRRVVARASSPLSNRLSVFWGDWQAVRTGTGEHFRLGPVDRLDLLESGLLLTGTDGREPSVRPSHEQLVTMSADFILGKFTADYLDGLQDAQALIAGGVRAVTKAILFPVRFAYTLGTGQIGLNDNSARWYADEDLPGSALALKAIEWRTDGLEDADTVAQLLDAELGLLHLECLTQYAQVLDGRGDSPRATALAQRAAYVDVAVPDGR